MNYKVYKWCMVPQCHNTTKKTPKKLFVYVPQNKTMRHKWLLLARRNPTNISLNSPIYFCEDHFDLPNDMDNYMQYHVMGSVAQVRMKPGCVPTKFECQSKRKQTSKSSKQSYYKRKKQKQAWVEECEKDTDENSSITKHDEIGGTTPVSSVITEVKIKALDPSLQLCDQCHDTISGFAFLCVQCEARVCGACDARGLHARHYVLRAPPASGEVSDNMCRRFVFLCEARVCGACDARGLHARHYVLRAPPASGEVSDNMCRRFVFLCEARVCGACDARGLHARHYVLRAPPASGEVSDNMCRRFVFLCEARVCGACDARGLHARHYVLRAPPASGEVSDNMCRRFVFLCEARVCGACDARGLHARHYVLRAPPASGEVSDNMCRRFVFLCEARVCGACDARGLHARHYVLRAPPASGESDLKLVLKTIRDTLTTMDLLPQTDMPDKVSAANSESSEENETEEEFAVIKMEVEAKEEQQPPTTDFMFTHEVEAEDKTVSSDRAVINDKNSHEFDASECDFNKTELSPSTSDRKLVWTDHMNRLFLRSYSMITKTESRRSHVYARLKQAFSLVFPHIDVTVSELEEQAQVILPDKVLINDDSETNSETSSPQVKKTSLSKTVKSELPKLTSDIKIIVSKLEDLPSNECGNLKLNLASCVKRSHGNKSQKQSTGLRDQKMDLKNGDEKMNVETLPPARSGRARRVPIRLLS